MTIRLYDYWRSSAAYRVRIALHLKGVAFESIDISLIDDAQRDPGYRAINPQGLIPMLDVDGHRITQSLAIIDWLDARFPDPRLIPVDPDARARALAQAMIIGADIHPINNLRVLRYLKRDLKQDQPAIDAWIRHWIGEGFAALEAMADPEAPFLGGAQPGIADAFLVPQMYNARRFETDLAAFPRLVAIDAACGAIDAFRKAHPDQAKED